MISARPRTRSVEAACDVVLRPGLAGVGEDALRKRFKAIAYMEGIVQPYARAEIGELGEFLDRLRGPEGEKMILDENFFIDVFTPLLIQREPREEEMQEYRRPHAELGEGRRSMLTMPREIPIDGEPAHTHEMVSRYSEWMSENDIPKLFVNAEPGAAITGAAREFCRTWRNQTEVTVKGLHFIQEDSPDEIGRAIADWHAKLGA